MADRKAYKAIWLGDGDPNSQIINLFGVEFIKGRPSKVPANLFVNGVDAWFLIRENPLFAIEDEDADLNEAPEDEELAGLQKSLDDLGVKYRANASKDSLRALLDKSTAPHS